MIAVMRTFFTSLETQCQPPAQAQAAPCRLPRRSAWLFGWFRAYARRYVRRHFHAVRVSREGAVPILPDGAVIVVLNHPSWWDPLIGLVLTDFMPASRVHYAPIEAGGLAQYPFLERLGFFGVEVGTTRGSMAFLRQSRAILARPVSILWITSQGEFVDPRERPVKLKEGVGHLVHRLSLVTIVPLALEYPFWNDRCPEALARFGDPITVSAGRQFSPTALTARMEQALQDTQDRLADEARRRNPAAFTTILGGTAGVGGVYDLWRRVKARVHGEPPVLEHQTGDHDHGRETRAPRSTLRD
jgi:1-acyl-sn-glycerol-3-phosphate acyltransferase